MLTRAGAARVLGKTVSTVRRLEGEVLFPQVDARGVHWFDPRRVERVAERMRDFRLRCAQGEYLRSRECRKRRRAPQSKLQRDNARLRKENARLARRVAQLERDAERVQRAW